MPDAINEMLAALWPAASVECLHVGPDAAVAELTVRGDDLRPGGFIAGPALFGVADAALWCLGAGALGRVEPMALTSELSIRFLRPAKGTHVRARATLDRVGRTRLVGTIRVWTDDESRPCAVAQGTYALG